MNAFQKFAVEKSMWEKVTTVSLGQGQGPVAEKFISSAMHLGEWVYLQVRYKLHECLFKRVLEINTFY